MWDAQLVNRVRDRKLNEMIVFASMARLGSPDVDTCVEIIAALGRDVDACDALLRSGGEERVSLGSIGCEEYLSRLTESELADERAFDAMKSAPEGQESIEDCVRRLLREAVDSIRGEDRSDDGAMQSVLEELRSCRQRVESLSQELDYAKSDAASARDALEEMTADRDGFSDKCGELRDEVSKLKAELESAGSRLSETEEARIALEERCNRLESEESGLRAGVKAAAEDAARLVGEMKEARERLEEAESARAELEARCKQLEADSADMRSSMDSSAAELDKVREALAETEGDRRMISERLEVSVTETARLNDRLAEVSEERDAAKARIGELEDVVSKLRGEVTSMSVERDDARARAEELGSRAETEAAELVALRQEVSDARARDAEASDLRQRLAEASDERDAAKARCDGLEAELASARYDLNVAEQKLSVLEPSYQDAMNRIDDLEEALAEAAEDAAEPEDEWADDVPPEDEWAEDEPEEPAEPEEPPEDTSPDAGAAEPPEETPAEEITPESVDPGHYMSRENIEAVKRIRAMKDEKIDQILDANLRGDIDMDSAEDIVDFLKVDIAVCDAILGIDFSDRRSVVEGFRRIVDVLQSSADPKHQDEYVASLTPEEAQLEYKYAQVLNSLQGMMMYARDDLL